MQKLTKLAVIIMFYQMLWVDLSSQKIIELNSSYGKIKDQQSPFFKISVIDNRFDSVFFTYLDGSYPLKHVNFKNGFSSEIATFLGSLCQNLNKSSKELIVAFSQFRIANTFILDGRLMEMDSSHGKSRYKILISDLFLRKDSQVALYPRGNGRELILISVDLFIKADSRITQIASVRSTVFLFYENFNDAISEFLIKLYGVAKLAYYKIYGEDSSIPKEINRRITNGMEVIFYDAKTLYSSESLIMGVREKWAGYPIFDSITPDRNGFYRYFILFLNNDFVNANVKLQYDPEDSTYEYLCLTNEPVPKYPLIVLYNHDYFLRIFENRYVKTYRRENTFHFNIPYTYPNCYEWLSHDKDFRKSPYKDDLGPKNLFRYAERLLSEGKEIKKIKEQIKNNSITKDEKFKKYRECFFDMDTGDVIFK